MSLSSSVQTKEIEAVYYQQNSRVEFRLLPNKLYSTDIIVANLGISKAADTGVNFSKWAGVYGQVQNATLFDGNTELSNLSDLAFWSGFKMFNKENQYNESVGHYYSGNNHNNYINESDTNANCDGATIFGAKITDTPIRALQPEVLDSNTYKGQIKLRMVFDLLNQMSYIDTSIFKNFRVVLELSNDVNRILKNRQDDSDLSTTRPFLSVHEVIDEEILANMMGKMGNVVYDEIEDDLVQIPVVTGLANTGADKYKTQINNYHISAFNSKTLGRILLWKQPANLANQRSVAADGGAAAFGIYNSDSFLGEVEQIRINGRNVLARSGIQGSNRRLAHMVDSWGNCSMNAFSVGLANSAPDAALRNRILHNGQEEFGCLDFVGIDMAGEKCSDLQIDLSRTGFFLSTQTVDGGNAGATDGTYANDAARTAASKYNAAHNMGIYCEVKKAIVMAGDGSYSVVYV
tara:strand:- start:2261 stop:3646 length:1386 start_codon:yes stop_codon:yes gene_type:complete